MPPLSLALLMGPGSENRGERIFDSIAVTEKERGGRPLWLSFGTLLSAAINVS